VSAPERDGRESGYHDRASAARQEALRREIDQAGAFIAGRFYVWVNNPYGKLSLRRTGLAVPGVFR